MHSLKRLRLQLNVKVIVGQWDRYLVLWNIFLACVQVYIIYLCFVYLGNSFKVKIEAASNDVTECPCDDEPSIGTLCFLYLHHH